MLYSRVLKEMGDELFCASWFYVFSNTVQLLVDLAGEERGRGLSFRDDGEMRILRCILISVMKRLVNDLNGYIKFVAIFVM